MILHVFDDTFEYRGRVENWLNLSWVEEYRGEGKFTLATYDTDQYAALLRHGWYLFRADRPAAMMIVKIERDTDANTITACGYTALHLLGRRVVNGKANVKNIESGIYSLINTYLRGLNQISTATAKGLPEEIEPDDDTDTEGKEIEGEEVLDAILDVLEESTYGIRANFDRTNKRHVVEVYAGVDRSYKAAQGGTLFKQEFGNLKSLVVTQDDDLYKNVAYVTGTASGDSENTTYYEYISPEVQNQKDRRELIVDGDSQEDGESTADWQKRQKQKGITALNERKNALTFEVELGLGVFGEKYDLGDKVTCKSDRYGLQFDTRIMEYQYSYRAGKETEKIVLGNKPADYVKGAIIKSKKE